MFTGIFIKLFRLSTTILLVAIMMGTNVVLASPPLPSQTGSLEKVPLSTAENSPNLLAPLDGQKSHFKK